MSDGVELQRDGNVAEIILARPHRRNALTPAMMAALTEVISETGADDHVGAIVVRGQDGFFCSGLDLKEISTSNAPAQAWTSVHAALAAIDMPVVAAVEGGAINAGAALALACDLLVVGEDSYIQIKEAEMGMTPPVNAAWLALRYPPSVGLQLALTCRRFTGRDLHRLGVALDVVATRDVAKHAHALAAQLAAYPRQGASAAKVALRAARGESLPSFLTAVDRARSRRAGDRDTAPTSGRRPQ